MNAPELRRLLKGKSPKVILMAILVGGFVLILPFWLVSTPEQKQHITVDTTALKKVETAVGLLDILPEVPDPAELESIARWVYLYSMRHDLSPELILAVIAVESQFDRFAISKAGARGLMQVMPFWKRKLGSKADNLFKIETNIRYGSAILKLYLDRYRKMSSALAAYNGSLGNHKYPNKIFAKMKQFKARL